MIRFDKVFMKIITLYFFVIPAKMWFFAILPSIAHYKNVYKNALSRERLIRSDLSPNSVGKLSRERTYDGRTDRRQTNPKVPQKRFFCAFHELLRHFASFLKFSKLETKPILFLSHRVFGKVIIMNIIYYTLICMPE